MPTASRCYGSATASRLPYARISSVKASPKSNAARWRSRPAMRRICTPLRREMVAPDGERRDALSAHLARIRRQEAARGRRDADLRFRPRLPQSRTRGAARAGIHHARMVPARTSPMTAVQDDCLALLRLAADTAGRRSSRFATATCDPRADVRAADGGAGVHLSRRASSCSRPCRRTARATATPSRPRRAAPGITVTENDNWSDIFSKVLTAARRAEARQGQADDPLRISALRSRARPRHAARSTRRRTLRALCLRRRTRQRLRRTDRSGRAARALRSRDGRRSSASMASAIRSTRISWTRSRRCRRPAASRSASTVW